MNRRALFWSFMAVMACVLGSLAITGLLNFDRDIQRRQEVPCDVLLIISDYGERQESALCELQVNIDAADALASQDAQSFQPYALRMRYKQNRRSTMFVLKAVGNGADQQRLRFDWGGILNGLKLKGDVESQFEFTLLPNERSGDGIDCKIRRFTTQ